MKLISGALILFLTVSTAYGLKCYLCVTTGTCTNIQTCPTGLDRCFTAKASGIVSKGCLNSNLCISPIKCCQGDLCNGAMPTGPSALLLLLSSAIIAFFV